MLPPLVLFIIVRTSSLAPPTHDIDRRCKRHGRAHRQGHRSAYRRHAQATLWSSSRHVLGRAHSDAAPAISNITPARLADRPTDRQLSRPIDRPTEQTAERPHVSATHVPLWQAASVAALPPVGWPAVRPGGRRRKCPHCRSVESVLGLLRPFEGQVGQQSLRLDVFDLFRLVFFGAASSVAPVSLREALAKLHV